MSQNSNYSWDFFNRQVVAYFEASVWVEVRISRYLDSNNAMPTPGIQDEVLHHDLRKILRKTNVSYPPDTHTYEKLTFLIPLYQGARKFSFSEKFLYVPFMITFITIFYVVTVPYLSLSMKFLKKTEYLSESMFFTKSDLYR